MGDMLPHDTVNQAAKTASGYNYRPLFSKVVPYLKDADMSFCNQESPSDDQLNVSGYPTFNAPARFAEDLSGLGCNLINLANNHANDRGQAGITATRQVWDRLPTLAVAGTARNASEQSNIALFTKGGVKFAFLSYAKCSNSSLATSYGLNILSRPLVNTQLAAARAAGAQMIIVATHWCRENVSHQDADQDAWASYLASKGVDIVIGTGPHWLQPVKQLPKAGGGKTVVWFSLGNFLSSQLEVNGLIGGIAVMEIDTKTHSVSDIGFMPTYMHYEWTAAQAAREDLLARHNLMIYPLDQAASALTRSQNHTTVSAQTTRVTQLLNTYTHVDMLTSRTFSSYGQ
jgi:poly-gamma-glutamate synthesis protein (capsule biosynthesis protein)